ncbi:MAG: helix-turn-helix transcriptional regulator [Campylobacterota bacterium]|nr:helix-turn-helix transcriptional regulator [Campylobacterota bacterium]
MIEFMTPYDIMEKFVDVIEKERIRKNMTQIDLYKAAGMSSKSYANFISNKTTKFENIINIMIALDMTAKLTMLLEQEKFISIDEIRNKKMNKERKRVRKDNFNERD